jgi:hypothetical protein
MRRPPASRAEHATRAGGRVGAVYTARRGLRQPNGHAGGASRPRGARLTPTGEADINRTMLLRVRRLLQASVAVVVIATFASWQPVMMASMTGPHPHAGHATHGAGTPGTPGAPDAARHHTLPLQCCDLCPVACAAPPGISGDAPRAAALELTHAARPVVDREPRLPRARPHALPFALGPPTLRVA